MLLSRSRLLILIKRQIWGIQTYRCITYENETLNRGLNPAGVGKLDKNAENVGTGIVGSPSCGDVLKLQIQVDEEGKVIEKAVFKTFGCVSAMASSSYVTEILEGKDLDEATQIKNVDISNHLRLPPIKVHCSVLAEEAIKAAINDYRSKHTDTEKKEGEEKTLEKDIESVTEQIVI